jgi:hypothetical protein
MAIKIGVSHANDRKSGGCCGSIETAVTRVTAQKDENKNANFTAFCQRKFPLCLCREQLAKHRTKERNLATKIARRDNKSCEVTRARCMTFERTSGIAADKIEQPRTSPSLNPA